MSRFSHLAAACALTLFAQSALADTTGYEITAKNTSAGLMTVAIDGKVSCSLEAGKSCKLDFTNNDAVLSYSLAGGPSVRFTTGNNEAADVCSIDATGAHCTDPNGQPTN